MTWNKPFSEVEIAYIEKVYPKKGCAEIAHKLGRSKRGVEKVVARLGLREPCACAPARADAPVCGHDPARDGQPEEEMQDELAELRQVKRVLKRTLRDDIDPKAIPKLSAELREVIRRISELEGGEGHGGDGNGKSVADLLAAIPLR